MFLSIRDEAARMADTYKVKMDGRLPLGPFRNRSKYPRWLGGHFLRSGYYANRYARGNGGRNVLRGSLHGDAHHLRVPVLHVRG